MSYKELNDYCTALYNIKLAYWYKKTNIYKEEITNLKLNVINKIIL